MNPAPSTRPARSAGLNRLPTPDFIRALQAVRRPAVIGHITPDADCLGSGLGLTAMLRARSIDAVMILPRRAAAQKLRFMLELADTLPVADAPPADADAAIIVDTATAKRANVDGGFDGLARLATFNIDHHITNTDFASHNWVDPHASSTSELIARLVEPLDARIDDRIASLLYAGIHGDTAGFSLPNTTADALTAAAELIRAGADVTHIGEQLCRSQNRRDFELLRRVFDHTRVTDDGLIAYSVLSYADIQQAGCSADDIDDQVSIPRALRGIRIAMLFTEGEPGVIRINLRGEGKVSVLEIAERFGGGGHTQSAGIRVRNKPMQAVIDELLAAARDHLARA